MGPPPKKTPRQSLNPEPTRGRERAADRGVKDHLLGLDDAASVGEDGHDEVGLAAGGEAEAHEIVEAEHALDDPVVLVHDPFPHPRAVEVVELVGDAGHGIADLVLDLDHFVLGVVEPEVVVADAVAAVIAPFFGLVAVVVLARCVL